MNKMQAYRYIEEGKLDTVLIILGADPDARRYGATSTHARSTLYTHSHRQPRVLLTH